MHAGSTKTLMTYIGMLGVIEMKGLKFTVAIVERNVMINSSNFCLKILYMNSTSYLMVRKVDCGKGWAK